MCLCRGSVCLFLFHFTSHVLARSLWGKIAPMVWPSVISGSGRTSGRRSGQRSAKSERSRTVGAQSLLDRRKGKKTTKIIRRIAVRLLWRALAQGLTPLRLPRARLGVPHAPSFSVCLLTCVSSCVCCIISLLFECMCMRLPLILWSIAGVQSSWLSQAQRNRCDTKDNQ